MELIQINLSLFVQVFNFFIAYVILERLLIRPAIEEIKQENIDMLKIQKNLETEKMLFEQIKKARENQWPVCKEYLREKSPEDSARLVDLKEGISIQSFHADKKMLAQLAREVENKLLERIDAW